MGILSAARATLLATAFIASHTTTVAAQEATEAADAFQLDLNSVTETGNGSCRLTYVATNQSTTALERASYQIALFDGEGVVTRLLVLEFGALTEGKTKILQFDLAETGCGSISRIVVNDSPACVTSDGTASDLCMAGLVASSRTPIQFGI
ncbi:MULTISPECIES: hypothetical protein [unclassified Epibacterium]|jgi:hypothetical protein|uniref:hypothetical protein n=1 Tax=unclassified Epibacterium TaxID=2639179 RepID=UPI001EF64FD5|nr:MULTISPECIES: hypothetical protein [unclassified Epibacterium]MCG7625012.1 hypothetical protein [Epibacterium sp. Ofav1-8]MCG7630481.1 hypothetical protein [Epibacterium sp. MM17-32]